MEQHSFTQYLSDALLCQASIIPKLRILKIQVVMQPTKS